MIMKWVPEYNTGIDVIDDQHRRILDYINEIDAIDVNTDRERVKQILENIIDYTQSHFTFEESLQEEAKDNSPEIKYYSDEEEMQEDADLVFEKEDLDMEFLDRDRK